MRSVALVYIYNLSQIIRLDCQVESADALEYPAAGAYIFSFQEKMEMAGHLHVKY
jgi:hypothetical protein